MSLKMPNLLEMLNATAETNRLDVTELTTKVSDEKQQKTIQIIFETVITPLTAILSFLNLTRLLFFESITPTSWTRKRLYLC